MTFVSPTQNLLRGKTALVLAPTGILGQQCALTLALAGCRIIGLGGDAVELQKIKREIANIRGRFDYLAVDFGAPNSLNRAIERVFETPGGVHFILNPAGIYPPGPARNVCQSLLAEYRVRRQSNLEHVIEVVAADAGNLPGRFPAHRDGVRESRLYLQQSPADDIGEDRLWPVPGVVNISPGAAAGEVLNLLADTAYRHAGEVTLRVSGSNVLAALYRVDAQGRPNVPEAVYRRGEALRVYLKPSGIGRGVFAAANFERGEPVFKATGAPIPFQTEHSIQIGPALHLEAEFPARVLNHSCEPNLGVKTNRAGEPDFVAFRDIRRGDELTFDYAMTELAHYPRRDPGLEFSLICRCGAPSCRGKLGYYAELPAEVKQKYKGFTLDYLSCHSEAKPKNLRFQDGDSSLRSA